MNKKTHPFNVVLELYQAGRRQKHECTCAPASMSLATHALGLEAKDEQAWLNPEFARFVPVEKFTTSRGMAIHEAQFLTELLFRDKLDILLRRAYPENFKFFRQDILDCVEGDDSLVVMNFAQDIALDRRIEGQGYPHFSPIAGYDQKNDHVLIADIEADFKEPYWIPLEKAYEAMALINPGFGIPRGWLRLKRRELS